MKIRFKPWQLAGAVILLCIAAVAAVRWVRQSRPYDAAGLLAALPSARATLLYIDTGLLRASGMLDLIAGSKAAEETDYRQFVEQTGFDYRTDLDAVAAAFVNGSVYITLRGRFQWKQLTGYAEAQGGECHYSVCTMPGSSLERKISFFPLTNTVLALAVSPQPRAVIHISPENQKVSAMAPAEPVWMSFPPSAFGNLNAFPAGTRSFISPLTSARWVTFAAGPKGDRLELRVEVACPSAAAAEDLAKQLEGTTELLKRMIQRDNLTPNPRDLSGVLVAGTFQHKHDLVIGSWPVERGFVEALAAGQIQ
ncbi:MAG: hypothetical protein EXQ47_03645 [Bryobacterales bacterium]|nr:hypothetical protein [Bryobacterales bacterium]